MHGERTQAYGDANTNTGEHAQRYVARTKVRLQVPHTFQESSVTQQMVSAFYYEYQICGPSALTDSSMHSLEQLCSYHARVRFIATHISLIIYMCRNLKKIHS